MNNYKAPVAKQISFDISDILLSSNPDCDNYVSGGDGCRFDTNNASDFPV